jgi:hypothetical protein
MLHRLLVLKMAEASDSRRNARQKMSPDPPAGQCCSAQRRWAPQPGMLPTDAGRRHRFEVAYGELVVQSGQLAGSGG